LDDKLELHRELRTLDQTDQDEITRIRRMQGVD
jgi:hypothetical protein